MDGKITIEDVARRAEVSTTTVSNLLNGRTGRMRATTKERVHRAIEELGYTPNRMARQLKTGQASIIGLILPSVANPFYGHFARYAEEVALQRGYQVLLGNSERSPARESTYAEELWGYGVRGIVVGSSLLTYSHLSGLIQKGLRIVSFDRPAQSGDPVSMISVGIDNHQAARIATKHLLSLGHRRIAFISGAIRTINRQERLRGYRSALDEAGIEIDSQLIWEGSTDRFGDAEAVELGRQGAHELLSAPNPPTAFFTINDMFAYGVYAGARDLGMGIPHDVSVMGFDDNLLAEIVEPPLTTIRQPLQEIAQVSVTCLLDGLEEKESELPHRTLVARLMVRGSTAAVREGG